MKFHYHWNNIHKTSAARSNYSPIANSVHNGPIHSFTTSADCEPPDSRFRQRNQPRLNLLDGVFQRPANFASSAPPPSETTGQRLLDGGEIEKETETRGVVRALLRTDATPRCGGTRLLLSSCVLINGDTRRTLTTILVYARLNDRRWVKPRRMSPRHWPWGERTSEKRGNISVLEMSFKLQYSTIDINKLTTLNVSKFHDFIILQSAIRYRPFLKCNFVVQETESHDDSSYEQSHFELNLSLLEVPVRLQPSLHRPM